MIAIQESREIKEICLNVLIQFDLFCRKHNLRYSLAGGTLLGAIRHKGYIPWDDDIDVLMPRPDYEKFINYSGTIGKNLAIKNKSNTAPCYYAYSKLINTDTIVYEDLIIGNESGLGMDIFPVDGLPESHGAQVKHINELAMVKTKIDLCTIPIKKGKTFPRYLLKILILPVARKLFRLDVLVDKVDKLARKYDFNNSKMVAAQTLNYGMKEILEKEEFEKYVELDFEGHRFMGISCYDRYLTNLFGDYMKLPPANQQRAHHKFKAYWRDTK